MPTEPIIFGNNQESGESELGGASPLAVNVLIDGKGVVRRRPGIATYSEVPTAAAEAYPVSALIESAVTDTLYGIYETPGGRKLYRFSGGAAVDMSTDSTKRLYGTSRPVLAETDAMIVMAGGSDPLRIYTATNDVAVLGGSPPTSTHILANSSRLVCNNLVDLGRFRYSGLASGSSTTGHETWSASNYFSAASRPDPISAMGETVRELWAWGTTSTQVYLPDPQTVYAPLVTLEEGIFAPYSTVRKDGLWYWLSSKKRFVASDGRSTKEVGGVLGATLDSLGDISDMFGYRVRTDQFDCLVWTSQTAGVTFCYQDGGGWSTWSGYDSELANWAPFTVNSSARRTTDGTIVVGLLDGRIGQLTTSSYTDLGDPIKCQVRTGHMNRGTLARKQCNAVRFLFKGVQPSLDSPIGTLRFRDDLGDWEPPIPLYIGEVNAGTCTVTERSLGVYETRQWEFEFSGSDELVLAGVEEDYTVMPR